MNLKAKLPDEVLSTDSKDGVKANEMEWATVDRLSGSSDVCEHVTGNNQTAARDTSC